MSLPLPQRERLAALRAEVRAIESAGAAGARGSLPFGLEALDSRLAGGGLASSALHESAGAKLGLGDDAAATLFLAAIAARLQGTVLWALGRRDLFAPGLAQAGLTPDRILYAECRRDEEILAVMEEGLRHGGLAAVVGEVGRVTMASTRRLQLAAEEGGDDGADAEALAESGRGPAWLPVRRSHALADRLRAVREAAGRRRRPAALERRARPPARRRTLSTHHGGLRCDGSPRSSCRTWP